MRYYRAKFESKSADARYRFNNLSRGNADVAEITKFFIIYKYMLHFSVRMCKAIVKNCNWMILCATLGKSLE